MNLPDLNFSTSQHCPPKVRGLARSLAIPLTLFLILLTGPTPATGAGPAGSDTQTVDAHARELIVLLAPDAFERSPAQLVEAVEQRSALPGSLATASPSSARLAVRTGHNLDSDDPTSPRARLARYVVLSFPATVDLDAARSQLLADPEIEFVEPNLSVPLSVLSNDPLLPITSNPAQHQWGIHQMNLPAAWDRMRGHAYLGLIDVGLDPTHPDLRPFPSYSTKGGCSYDPGPFQGGNFRPHLSWDVFENDCDVTEDHPTNVGHGTHVAGISAATTDNATGVAGHCWHCPVMMAKASSSSTLLLTYASVADSITFLVDRGAQSISMSFGFQGSCQSGALAILCTALQLAADHDVVLTASSGNGKRDINFPASDGRVLAIGGLQPGGVFWDEETIGTGECPCERDPRASPLCSTLLTAECGSNYSLTPGSSEQTLVVPARSVVSTFVPGGEWNPVIGCTDADLFPNGDGYGPCTGTSMASPAASALAGLVRSVNPLLDRGEVATALTSTASMAGSGDPKMGNGIPDAAAAVAAAFGEAGGQPIENRLTPLLSVWSTAAQTHLFTTVPQQIQAAFFDQELTDFAARGQALSFYLSYPEIPACQFGPCPVRIPTASVAILTSHVDPGTGLGAPVPLHRMSFDGPYTTGNPRNRSFAYTISDAEIGAFAQEGYRLDGLEGYLLPRCSPEPSCRPAGTTTLHRLYNSNIDDYLIVPAAQVAGALSDGYAPLGGAYPEILGYAFTLDDADGDHLLDGFEGLIGTDPQVADTDCDGLSDGAELPPAGLPVGDPLDAGCGADLRASVAASVGSGGLWNVITAANNLGPLDASSVELEVLFTSWNWDWYIPVVPQGCVYISPPKGTIPIGTEARYRCPVGSLTNGHLTSLGFGVQPSRDPSILDITVTVSSATLDQVPANDQASTQLNGGLLW